MSRSAQRRAVNPTSHHIWLTDGCVFVSASKLAVRRDGDADWTPILEGQSAVRDRVRILRLCASHLESTIDTFLAHLPGVSHE